MAPIKTALIVISGVCWTIVYIQGIRIGFRDKSYAIPFYALALNFAWELVYTFYGFKINGLDVQNVFSAVWLTFDVGILYTYFKFGRKYFPSFTIGPSAYADGTDLRVAQTSVYESVEGHRVKSVPLKAGSAFILWSVLALITALLVEYAIRREFGVAKGAGYSAFLQNLLMSILFIAMLVKRGSSEGQSLTIAINKWIGTLAPTILYGIVGEGGFPHGSFFILVTGALCSVFDLIYIFLLAKLTRMTIRY